MDKFKDLVDKVDWYNPNKPTFTPKEVLELVHEAWIRGFNKAESIYKED